MFFNPQKYDFSRVGRLKLNTKLGLKTPLDEKILHPQDFYEVLKYQLKLRKNPQNVDDIDHLGNRRVALGRGSCWRTNSASGSSGMERGDQGKDVGVPGNGHRHAARPNQREAGDGRDSGVLWVLAALSVHGPNESALRDHA